MKWLASIAIAILTSIIGLFAAGTLGGLLVDWYNISSFEGGAGVFVVAIAIFGLMGSFVIGLVTARVVAARPNPGFLKALGAACGVVIGILVVIAGGARLLADIPPTIDGETLFLQIELRWPASGRADPKSIPGIGYTRLGTSTGSIVRRTEEGPLFVEDARREDGRWIVPGAVDVFTARGQRVLMLGIGDTQLGAFIVPLPGHPRQDQRTWSDWLPRPRNGSQDADQYTYRFRVVRQSEPVRVERLGPFDVGSIARYFYNVQGAERLAANAEFDVRFKGQPITGLERARSVALVTAPRATLLVSAEQPDGGSSCHFVSDEGDRAQVQPIGTCGTPLDAKPITSDSTRFREARTAVPLPGWLDRSTFASPGLFLVDDLVLDTRSFRAWTLASSSPRPIQEVPPLTVSPDERAFARLAHEGSDGNPMLVVVDFHANQSYTVPIDRARMRYSTHAAIDPAWVDHHFHWVPGREGHDQLEERPTFTTLPYIGEFTVAKPGQYQTYTIRPGREPLRAAIVSILLAEPRAERIDDELNGYHQRVRIDGRVLSITVVDSEPYVYVSMERGKQEPEFMTRIARRLDAAFATGKYDNAFETRGK